MHRKAQVDWALLSKPQCVGANLKLREQGQGAHRAAVVFTDLQRARRYFLLDEESAIRRQGRVRCPKF
jgi:hypothetical protein